MSSFHLNHKFYVVPRRMSSRITPLQKKSFFPHKSYILYCSQEVFNSRFLHICHMYYRKKREIFLKKLFCATIDDLGCITEWAEDGYFGKGTCFITHLKLIFIISKSFSDVPNCFFVLFLKKGGNSVRNTCGKQLKPNKDTELLVVV